MEHTSKVIRAGGTYLPGLGLEDSRVALLASTNSTAGLQQLPKLGMSRILHIQLAQSVSKALPRILERHSMRAHCPSHCHPTLSQEMGNVFNIAICLTYSPK